ncbi:MAG: 1-(5-phosphoribosyl)-5-[(5-phosphoribosylamino)methylideneamino]imidazole-4-carboxamide isomerase [Nitrospirae bacterium]|nr:1-(5-phosphoribosyl)-5-[(5-phosphoribosylamino)methylideneamino]imidazole-4-carboxamide isomerase [Nitrospirota bacterium]MBI3605981.1 1-(5-phosphoribosyl)-5-[(5-phosphoribosylamino)methylideneamino]imidazole-4-carboxamide isomerase [Nitrospirota bacterium]
MKLFPAIDIKNGECVRLKQGKFDQKEVFSIEPESIAKKWREAGAEMIHVVDLDGALSGKPVNREVIRKILKTVPTPIQVGGGIREFETIESYLSMGVSRVVLGTSIIKNIDLLKKAAKAFPGQIVAGIDAKNGKIAISGWTDVTGESAVDYGRKISALGIAALVYTDIEKDGMMEGPNFRCIEEMAGAMHVPLVVSGGVSSLKDIRRIMEMKNIEGIIIGKALYTGAISLEPAIAIARGAAC